MALPQPDPHALERRIAKLERRLANLAPQFTPLAVVLSSTSYNGNDTINVGTVTIDSSAVFGAPSNMKAALVFVSAQWAAASGSSTLSLRATGGATNRAQLVADSTNFQTMQAVIYCDANGDFDVVVANANATNVTILILGYWL